MNEALTSIKGIGPGREKQLHKLGIDTVSNLLAYFPRSYEDRRKIYSIKELETGITAGVVGTVVSITEKTATASLIYFRSYHHRWNWSDEDCIIQSRI